MSIITHLSVIRIDELIKNSPPAYQLVFCLPFVVIKTNGQHVKGMIIKSMWATKELADKVRHICQLHQSFKICKRSD